MSAWDELSKVAISKYVRDLKIRHSLIVADLQQSAEDCENKRIEQLKLHSAIEEDYERKRQVCVKTIKEQRDLLNRMRAKLRKLAKQKPALFATV